ncbi:MAG TPA: TIGR04219 family outer membrane beta-barrel protein [Sulfurovum sp.]
MSSVSKLIFVIFVTLYPLHADVIGGGATLGFFSHDPDGDASYQGTSANLNDTFGFNEKQDIFLKAYLEHPLPLLPNIKLGYTALSHEGSSNVDDFTWGDIVNYSGSIDSRLSLDFTDVTLYYELLDNWAEVDAGLTFRYICGDMGVHSTDESDSVDFTAWIPMLYGKVRFNMPVTNLSLQIEANAISYWDVTTYDYELSARYTVLMGLGLEAGYKALHLNSDELVDGFNADIGFSGPYAAVIWDF